MRITLFILGLCYVVASGCTVVSANRVFPKLTWYWSMDAKEQRREDAQEKLATKMYQETLKTNGVTK